MQKGNGSYVFMLVYVDDEWLDMAGNKYPIEGFIEAEKFSDDIDILKGLYGAMWGKISSFSYEHMHKGHWVVVKTEHSEDLIKTAWQEDRYKFKSGWVVHTGNLRSAGQFILDKKDDPQEMLTKDADWLLPEDVAGSEEWLREHWPSYFDRTI